MIRYLAAALLALTATPATGDPCATFIAALATVAPGGTVTLAKGATCEGVKITRDMPRQTTVNLGGATLRGLVITGSNWRVRSGTLRAIGGAHMAGPLGYGVKIAGKRIRIDGALVTDAKKGIVVDLAADVTIADSRFLRLGEDGIIASRVRGFQVVRNRFAGVLGKPSECQVGMIVTYSVAKRDCRGAWTDGYHADAVQMRNGVTDALIASNLVEGSTQGITQMDTTGDAPLERVTIRDNVVMTSTYHPITLTACIRCLIEKNVVRRAPGSAIKAVIRPGEARRCENDVQDEKVQDRACPA